MSVLANLVGHGSCSIGLAFLVSGPQPSAQAKRSPSSSGAWPACPTPATSHQVPGQACRFGPTQIHVDVPLAHVEVEEAACLVLLNSKTLLPARAGPNWRREHVFGKMGNAEAGWRRAER